MPKRQDYIDYILAGFRADATRVEVEIKNWRRIYSEDNALLGYMPPKFPLQVAAVAAFLFEYSGEEAYERTARDLLLRFPQYTSHYPPEAAQHRPEYSEGVPPLEAVFDPLVFAPACRRIWDTLSEDDRQIMADIAARSLLPVWRFPEWGGHNRAMLRAASLASCASVFHEHPQAAEWNSLADELAEESWGRWSIEDTMMYQAHWLRAMIVYAEARGKPDLDELIQPRMYLRAIVQLLSPLGILPDFGDSHWLMHSHWEWLALLEWGAKTYQNPAMKWAAEQIWNFQKNEPANIYAALVLTLAWSWADDGLKTDEPRGTADALDDLVMKKLVFRTGWRGNSAYACLNYRDEGDYARVARDYLRTNLAVSAEKMHHGHSDEGSFSMLVSDRTLLLHESGYREKPPDGIYRADVYHNRVVWRPGIRLAATDTWEYLTDQGHYRPVRTERLYQSKLLDLDVSRIRTTDEVQNLIWDRSIIFLPSPACWIVVDSLLSTRTLPRTISSLWWTTDILESRGPWVRTHLRGIQSWVNERNATLWIALPGIPGQQVGVSQHNARRSFQEEVVIVSSWSGEHLVGRCVNFVSVLMPKPYHRKLGEEDVSLAILPSLPTGRALGIEMKIGNQNLFACLLNDLTSPWLQENVRPRYSAEQGWYQVGPVGTDCAFVVLRNENEKNASEEYQHTAILNGTRLEYRNQQVFQMLPNTMFQEDGSNHPGVTARFRWTGDI